MRGASMQSVGRKQVNCRLVDSNLQLIVNRLAPELHEVVPFDAINLTPREAGCDPREPGKTGTRPPATAVGRFWPF